MTIYSKVLSIYRSLATWVVHITMCSDRGVGEICNIAAFYYVKAAHVYIITTYNKILHTNTPAQYCWQP